VDFSDIGHTLFTVQPYQNVPGCMVQQPSPQGPLVDSTSNILFHETTETITDPDGDAWLNLNDLVMYGSEIADECEQAAFSYPSVLVFNTEYAIQGDYSNASHRCSYSPF